MVLKVHQNVQGLAPLSTQSPVCAFEHPLGPDQLQLTSLGFLNDAGFPKDLEDVLFIIIRIPGMKIHLKKCSVTFLLNSSVFGPVEDLSRARTVQ